MTHPSVAPLAARPRIVLAALARLPGPVERTSFIQSLGVSASHVERCCTLIRRAAQGRPLTIRTLRHGGQPCLALEADPAVVAALLAGRAPDAADNAGLPVRDREPLPPNRISLPTIAGVSYAYEDGHLFKDGEKQPTRQDGDASHLRLPPGRQS